MNHFIDEVNIIINGDKYKVITITGAGSYNPSLVKNKAIERIRNSYPDSRLVAVILSHREVTAEEYREIIGSNPPWLYNMQ